MTKYPDPAQFWPVSTFDKAEFLKLYNVEPRLTYAQIAARLGVKWGTMINHLNHMQAMQEIAGRSEAGKLRVTAKAEARLQQVEAMRRTGATWQEIGAELHLSVGWLKTYVGRYRPALFELHAQNLNQTGGGTDHPDHRRLHKPMLAKFGHEPRSDATVAISGHPTAPRLEQLAEELDAEIIRRARVA